MTRLLIACVALLFYQPRLLALAGSLALAACSGTNETADRPERPNIVWIVSEDNSASYLRLYDPAGAATPNIEALAREGVVFTNAYSNGAVCSVARTTLATGVLAPRIGTQFHRRHQFVQLPEGWKLAHEYLSEVGYYTSNNHKLDYNVTAGTETWDDSSETASWRNRPDPGQPFFHMESHSASHESRMHFNFDDYENIKTIYKPQNARVPGYLPDTDLQRYAQARYLDRMLLVDEIVGKTVASLEEDGLLEDTVIFYFGDHGGVLPRSKGYAYESGLRVPLVIRMPEKYRKQFGISAGSKSNAIVDFTDLAATLPHLAGLIRPEHFDGTSVFDASKEDGSLGYADRFDEKYEFIRTIRRGKYRYMRFYQPWLPDGLRNNYRYRSLAWQEWQKLFEAGQLNAGQSAFFRAKSVEAVFDVEADPDNTVNLAGDPALAETTLAFRALMREQLADMADTGFYPESYLMAVGAFGQPVAFAEQHHAEIRRLIEISDLALLPWDDARPAIQKAINSERAAERRWGILAASAFGEDSAELAPVITPLMSDPSPHVRHVAMEWIGLATGTDPQPLLAALINQTNDAILHSEIMNSIVYFQDHSEGRYSVDCNALDPANGPYTGRRMEYLCPASAWLEGNRPR